MGIREFGNTDGPETLRNRQIAIIRQTPSSPVINQGLSRRLGLQFLPMNLYVQVSKNADS